ATMAKQQVHISYTSGISNNGGLAHVGCKCWSPALLCCLDVASGPTRHHAGAESPPARRARPSASPEGTVAFRRRVNRETLMGNPYRLRRLFRAVSAGAGSFSG